MKHPVRDFIQIIILALLVFAGVRVAVQNFQIDGPSMEPGLHNGQYLLVSKAAYWFGEPQRGDVIIFHSSQEPNRDLVKRIIGMPGDRVEIKSNGLVYINGGPLEEPYVSDPSNSPFESVTVPADGYFVLGDNRNNSLDSRIFGPVPRDKIIGKAWLIIWRISDWGRAPNYPLQASQDSQALNPAAAS